MERTLRSSPRVECEGLVKARVSSTLTRQRSARAASSAVDCGPGSTARDSC